MMIQATIPSALGIFMTPWLLDAPCSRPACSPCCPSACCGCASALPASPCRCCRRRVASTPCSPSTWAGTSTREDGAARFCRRTVAAAPSWRGSHARDRGRGALRWNARGFHFCALYATKVLSISGNPRKIAPVIHPRSSLREYRFRRKSILHRHRCLTGSRSTPSAAPVEQVAAYQGPGVRPDQRASPRLAGHLPNVNRQNRRSSAAPAFAHVHRVRPPSAARARMFAKPLRRSCNGGRHAFLRLVPAPRRRGPRHRPGRRRGTSRLTVICPRDELGSLRKQICLDFSAAGLDVSQVQIDQGSDPGMASACITVNCPRIARRTDVPGPSPERQPRRAPRAFRRPAAGGLNARGCPSTHRRNHA